MKKILYLLLLPLGLLACEPEAPPVNYTAYCSLQPFITDSTTLSWIIDDITLPLSQNFGEVEDGALVLQDPEQSVQVVVREAYTGAYLVNTRATLTDGGKYHFLLTGDLEQVEFIALQKDAAPGNGFTSLRFQHALGGDTAVDIYLGDIRSEALVSGLAYPAQSALLNLDVLAAKDTLRVFRAGSRSPDDLLTVFTEGVDLLNNASYLMVLAPLSADSLDAPVVLWPRN